MSDLYSIKQMPEYRLFLPPVGYCDTAEAQARRDQRKQRNRAAVEAAGLQEPKMPITGSFIYAHPPNYKGAETINWDKKMWLQELSRLKGYGIDTVIFQAALWSELQECY